MDLSGEGVDDRKGLEVAPSDPHMKDYRVHYVPNQITQVFAHPGSGKTRIIAKDLIKDGMNMYGQVYFTGPTIPACQEAYSALKNMFPYYVSLRISCSSLFYRFDRGPWCAPVMITTHAIALSMLTGRTSFIAKKGLWILDESHFMDSKTLVLKDFLRHKVAREHFGSLVELTATGYDIIKGVYTLAEGSNSPIQDIQTSVPKMIAGILEDCKKKKVMVFVTAPTGHDETTAASLGGQIKLIGGDYIILYGKNFDKNYKKAKKMTTGVILTTDVSECGDNTHPDIVYDFQMTSKVISDGTMALRVIDQGQRTQRRGRVGRQVQPKFPAIYVSPGYDLPQADFSRIEHHERHAAAKVLGIEIKDPKVAASELDDLSLTANQVAAWVAAGAGGGLHSLRAIHMTTSPSGISYPPDEMQHRIDQWAALDSATLRRGPRVTSCAWVDHRDTGFLLGIAERLGKIPMIRNSKRFWNDETIQQTIYRLLNKGGYSMEQDLLSIIRE